MANQQNNSSGGRLVFRVEITVVLGLVHLVSMQNLSKI